MKRKAGYGYDVAGPSSSTGTRKYVKSRKGTSRGYVRPITVVPRVYGNPLTRTERKYYDTALSSQALITVAAGSWAGGELDPGTVNALSAPAQGTDINNRIGRKFGICALRIKGYITVPIQTNQTATDAPTLCRLCVVLDKQTNGVQLNAEDVIGSDEGNAPGITMFQDATNLGRFKVYKDKMFNFDSPRQSWDGTNIEQGGMIRHFKWNLKFKKPIIVHTNSTSTAGVGNIVDHSFHIIGGCSDTSLGPLLSYKSRCVFIDV